MAVDPSKVLECNTRVLSNVQVDDRLYVLSLAAPEIARAIEPGQFVHLKIPHLEGHILRRPFSVYARNVEEGTLEILYQVVGEGTDAMTSLIEDEIVNLMGPIGQSWDVPADAKRALLVGGGVGAAPLYMLCEELLSRGCEVRVVLGAASGASLVTRERYESLCGCAPDCATDDGTYGREGFCTALAQEAITEGDAQGTPFDFIAVCGPEPLMRIVSGMAQDANIPCQVSLEKRMACGIGACLSCVVDTTSGKQRVCVNGPIFDAEDILW